MSRSYRKPYIKDRDLFMKRYANSVVRNAKDVPNGKAYRKFMDPYSICDYKFRIRPTSWRDKDDQDRAGRLMSYKKAMRK